MAVTDYAVGVSESTNVTIMGSNFFSITIEAKDMRQTAVVAVWYQ